jgi:anti-anti-sigma regulatory factor
MAGLRLKRWVEDGRRVLRLLGMFDGTAARDLLSHVQAEVEQEIVIDVSFVRGFDEVGVAALARLVQTSTHRRIAVRGLSTHQLRILRYLGASLSELAAGIER